MTFIRITTLLIIAQLSFGYLFSQPADFHLIKKAAARENSDAPIEAPSPQEYERYLQEALTSDDNKLTPSQQETLLATQKINHLSADLDVYYGNQPRLIMNPTDIQILKSKLDFSSAKMLFGTADDLILTKLANDIKESDSSRASDLIKTALKDLSDPRIKLIVNSALTSVEKSRAANLPPEEQNSYLQTAKEQIYDLAADKNFAYQDPKLKAYQDLKLDRRTLESLIYLVTPSAEGGAGHERIRVERIWKGFEQKGHSPQNHPQLTDKKEEDPHHLGQALDISEIDTLKCTLIKKKRLGSDKHIPQTPVPIKVKYQTKEGVSEAVPPSGETLNDIFTNFAEGNLGAALEELGLVSNLNQADLKTASIDDIGYYLGSSFVMSVLQTKRAPRWSDMKSGVEALGAAYIEKEIGLPRGTFTGSNWDEMMTNLGRRDLEDRLRLPAGSLIGKNGAEILTTVGREHWKSQTQGGTAAGIAAAKASYHPSTIDEALGLPEGAFAQAEKGNPETFRQIGLKIISERFSSEDLSRLAIQSFLSDSPVTWELPGWAQDSQPRIANSAASLEDIRRSFQQSYENQYQAHCQIQGGTPSWEIIGGYPKSERAFARYHCQKKFDATYLPEADFISLAGIDATDFERIFKGQGADEVFKHRGQKIFANLLKNSQLAQEKEWELLAEHPEIQEIKAKLDFRKKAWEEAQKAWQTSQKLIAQSHSRLKNNPDYLKAKQQAEAQARLAAHNPSLSKIQAAATAYQKMLDIAEAGISAEQSEELKTSATEHIRLAYYYLRAAIEGEYPPFSKEANALSPSQRQPGENAYAKLKANQPLLGLIKNIQADLKSPQEAALLYGAAQAAAKLNLPGNAFNFLLTPHPTLSPTSFFISVGKARVQEIANSALTQYLTNAGAPKLKQTLLAQAKKIDQALGIYPGTTQKLINESAQENFERRRDDFYASVGREVLKHTAIAQAARDLLNVGDQYLTPQDIYQLLSGQTEEIFKKLAGAKLDSQLRLAPGRGYRLFGSHGQEEAKAALAQISADYAGNLLGIAPFDLSGSVPRNMMMSRLERALGLMPGTVSQSQSLGDLVAKNGVLTFAQAFRIPLPFSANYTPEKFQQDLSLASQPETAQNKAARDQAQQSLTRFSQAVKDRLRQINSPDSSWWRRESDLNSASAKEIANFQQAVKQIDLLLYLPQGSTQKFLSGKIGLSDYIGIGAQKKNNLKYILKGSNVIGSKIIELSNKLAEDLGLEKGSVYFNQFSDQMSRLIDWGTNNPGDTSVISGQKNVFEPDKQIVQLFSLKADQEAGLEPGTLGKIIFDSPAQRNILLTEAGMKYFEDQFGLSNKITRYFKYEGWYNNCRHGFSNPSCSSSRDMLSFVGNLILDKAHLDPNNRQNWLIAQEDASLLIRGDTRILSSVAAAYMVDELLNPQQEDNPVSVPANLAPTYLDIRAAFIGKTGDQAQIKAAGDRYYEEHTQGGAEIEQMVKAGMDDKAIADFSQGLKQEGARQKQAQLRRAYQKNLQYKLMDSQLYKLDQHIPAGFTQKMMGGNENDKALALADLGLNYIQDDSLVGAIFKNDTAAREAVLAYIKNPSSETAGKITINGFNALEGFMNSHRVFGNIKIENGTFKAIYQGVFKGGNAESFKQMSADLSRLYKTQWKDFSFSLADEKLGIPLGTAKSIYNAYTGFESALGAYKNARAAYEAARSTAGSNLNELSDNLDKASSNLKAAKNTSINLVVNLAVNQLFGDQLGRLDQKLGLVPGSMAMVVSTGIAYALGALGPAGWTIAGAMFLITNLFGVYKVKLVCSADGYYPSLASAPTEPALNLGLGVFDGKNTSSYQAGMMRAAQAKVNDLISDMMDMGYHYKKGGKFSVEPYGAPDELTKPIQIITFRREDLDSFFGTRRYREVFNADPPSQDNRQGIGISDLVSRIVHIGF